MLEFVHLYLSKTCLMNSSFRQNLFYLTLILVFATVLSACGDDDVDDMLMNCPAPVDAFVLSNCLMDIPSELRAADDPDETFKVDLYKYNDTYYYAFIPAAFNNTKIEVYDACCNYICRIGFPITEECTWIDEAEDLGTIFEE